MAISMEFFHKLSNRRKIFVSVLCNLSNYRGFSWRWSNILDFIVCMVPHFLSSIRNSFSTKKGKQNQDPKCRKVRIDHSSIFWCVLT